MVIGFDSKSTTRRSSRAVLRSIGISPTFHRLQMADVVSQSQQHITAEEVYAQLNARWPESRATAYNALKILVDHGLLRKVTVESSRVFYDSNISPYHHFFDTNAGELKDIEGERFEILGVPEPPPGKSVAGVDVVVRLKLTD